MTGNLRLERNFVAPTSMSSSEAIGQLTYRGGIPGKTLRQHYTLNYHLRWWGK